MSSETFPRFMRITSMAEIRFVNMDRESSKIHRASVDMDQPTLIELIGDMADSKSENIPDWRKSTVEHSAVKAFEENKNARNEQTAAERKRPNLSHVLGNALTLIDVIARTNSEQKAEEEAIAELTGKQPSEENRKKTFGERVIEASKDEFAEIIISLGEQRRANLLAEIAPNTLDKLQKHANKYGLSIFSATGRVEKKTEDTNRNPIVIPVADK